MARDEGYVRPPIVAFDAADERAARLRLRLILIAAAIALAVGVWFLSKALLAHGEGGLGNEGNIHQLSFALSLLR